jgi:hypothetical protein
MKLKLFRSHLSKGEMCHFRTCAQRIPQRKHAELGEEYAKQIGLLAVYRNKHRKSSLRDFYKSLDSKKYKNLTKLHCKYSAFLEALTYVNKHSPS